MNDKELNDIQYVGGVPLVVTVLDIGGKAHEVKLAFLTPEDRVTARQELCKMRTRGLIDACAGQALDADVFAKALADVQTRPLQDRDMIFDMEGRHKLLEISAKRAGFNGQWQHFLNGLREPEVNSLLNKVLIVCGYGKTTPDEKADKDASSVPFVPSPDGT